MLFIKKGKRRKRKKNIIVVQKSKWRKEIEGSMEIFVNDAKQTQATEK